jgi:hypothetical protein
VIIPTASQMHALQLLREGDLVWNNPNSLRFQRAKGKEPRPVYAEPVDERIHPSTARVLVRERWIELKGFNPREGMYQLSASGRALTELLCECAESEVEPKAPENGHAARARSCGALHLAEWHRSNHDEPKNQLDERAITV